jgi:hypothetical protein
MPLESFRKLITLVITTVARRRCCRRFFSVSLESFRKLITLVTTTGNRRRCCRRFFFNVGGGGGGCPQGPRELSSENDKASRVRRIRNRKKKLVAP